MKVIGGGFGRTGTKSLQQALHILGFDPCHHMTEVYENPQQINFWMRASRGQITDWNELLGKYQAGVDLPTSLFVEELINFYPDAKVVLTVRDPERWYESAYESIYQITKIPRWMLWLNPKARQLAKMTKLLIWNGFFEGRFTERPFAIQRFIEHNDRVKQIVPADRLLVFSVKEGWEPLCHFLNVPMPDRPFPHVNERAEMQQRLQAAQKIPRVIATIAVSTSLTLAGLFFWRRNNTS